MPAIWSTPCGSFSWRSMRRDSSIPKKRTKANGLESPRGVSRECLTRKARRSSAFTEPGQPSSTASDWSSTEAACWPRGRSGATRDIRRDQDMTQIRGLWVDCLLVVGLGAFLVDVGPAAADDPEARELTPAWSLKGGWSGVVGDEKEDIVYALDASGKCLELDSMGKTRREFKLPKAGNS